MEKRLNPAEEYELKFLRQQVDDLSQKRYEIGDHENVSKDHERAREELKRFVFKLRVLGREI